MIPAPMHVLPNEHVPRVSVVMPVRNALPYLDEAIGSILSQTLEDLELVILDDRSTDGSRERLSWWAGRDPRIRIFDAERSLGLSGSSQQVVELARAPVVARMDADDISHPTRLRRQLDVLEKHEDAVLVGTLWEGITPAGRRARSRDRWRLWTGRPFAPFTHGSIMFRRSAFDSIGGYRPEAVFWEDFDLYLRMSTVGRILVVPEALYRYRLHISNSRITADRKEFARAMDLFHRSCREYRAGRDHTLLHPRSGDVASDRDATDAYVLFIEASTRIWCGERPAVMKRVVERRLLPTTLLNARLWLFAAAGELSPSLFRFALRSFVRTRDILASLFVSGAAPVEWRYSPHGPRRAAGNRVAKIGAVSTEARTE